jgi:sulfite oxidase
MTTVLAEPNHPPFKLLTEEPGFKEEREGWTGYWEWEKYPEKKKQAAEILAKYQFPPVGRNIHCIQDAHL